MYLDDDASQTAVDIAVPQSRFVQVLVHLLAAAIILTVIASSSQIRPDQLGNRIAVLSHIFFLIVVIYGYRRLSLPRFPLLVFVLIYLIFIINAVRIFTGLLVIPGPYATLGDTEFYLLYLLTMLSYVLGSVVTVFVIPAVIDRDTIFGFIAIVSTITVLVGLPAYFLGDFHIGGIPIDTYTSLSPLRDYGVYVPALASYFGDANAFSKIALAGIFTSLHQYLRDASPITRLMIWVNAVGLFLGNSRTAMFGALVALSIYIAYTKVRHRIFALYVILLGIGGATGFLMLVFFTDAVPILSNVDFSGRLDLWRGTIRAIVQNPILGGGIFNPSDIVQAYSPLSDVPGAPPQNSYLRIFVMTGAIGGFAYIGLIGVVVSKYISFLQNRADAALFGFFVALLIIQLTDTADPFGINKNSMIVGLVFGYVIKDIYF